MRLRTQPGHSFALYMLVVLNALMDQRYGLTEEE